MTSLNLDTTANQSSTGSESVLDFPSIGILEETSELSVRVRADTEGGAETIPEFCSVAADIMERNYDDLRVAALAIRADSDLSEQGKSKKLQVLGESAVAATETMLKREPVCRAAYGALARQEADFKATVEAIRPSPPDDNSNVAARVDIRRSLAAMDGMERTKAVLRSAREGDAKVLDALKETSELVHRVPAHVIEHAEKIFTGGNFSEDSRRIEGYRSNVWTMERAVPVIVKAVRKLCGLSDMLEPVNLTDAMRKFKQAKG